MPSKIHPSLHRVKNSKEDKTNMIHEAIIQKRGKRRNFGRGNVGNNSKNSTNIQCPTTNPAIFNIFAEEKGIKPLLDIIPRERYRRR